MIFVVLAGSSLILRSAWCCVCAAGGALRNAGVGGTGGTCVLSASVACAAVARALSSAVSVG